MTQHLSQEHCHMCDYDRLHWKAACSFPPFFMRQNNINAFNRQNNGVSFTLLLSLLDRRKHVWQMI